MLWTEKLMQSFSVLRIWKDIEESEDNKRASNASFKSRKLLI
jgi:hypothetical protein